MSVQVTVEYVTSPPRTDPPGTVTAYLFGRPLAPGDRISKYRGPGAGRVRIFERVSADGKVWVSGNAGRTEQYLAKPADWNITVTGSRWVSYKGRRDGGPAVAIEDSALCPVCCQDIASELEDTLRDDGWDDLRTVPADGAGHCSWCGEDQDPG